MHLHFHLTVETIKSCNNLPKKKHWHTKVKSYLDEKHLFIDKIKFPINIFFSYFPLMQQVLELRTVANKCFLAFGSSMAILINEFANREIKMCHKEK